MKNTNHTSKGGLFESPEPKHTSCLLPLLYECFSWLSCLSSTKHQQSIDCCVIERIHGQSGRTMDGLWSLVGAANPLSINPSQTREDCVDENNLLAFVQDLSGRYLPRKWRSLAAYSYSTALLTDPSIPRKLRQRKRCVLSSPALQHKHKHILTTQRSFAADSIPLISKPAVSKRSQSIETRVVSNSNSEEDRP